VSRDDAGLQHISSDKCLTSASIIFTLLFEVILVFLGLRKTGHCCVFNICMEQ
jgi:hypothetical protein